MVLVRSISSLEPTPVETQPPIPWFQCFLWWAITLIAVVYRSIVGWRMYWATLKIPLDKLPGATFPLPGRRSDYANFAFVATFVAVSSLWFGLADLAGARLGWGWAVVAFLLGKWFQWGMKMRLWWFVFEDEKQSATNETTS
jgi:hypothetical protein